MPEALTLKPAQRTAKLLSLAANHVRAEITVRSRAVALLAQLHRNIENNCNRQNIMLTRQGNQRLTRLRLHIGRVDNREPAGGETFGRDEMEHIKCVSGSRLVVFVVGNQGATAIRRQHLGRLEMCAAKARLAGAGDANQDHK